MIRRQCTSRSSTLISSLLARTPRKDVYRNPLPEHIRRIHIAHSNRSSRLKSFNTSSIPPRPHTASKSRLRIPSIHKPHQQQTRPFTTSPAHNHGELTPPKPGEERHVTFIDKEGSPHTFAVADGDNLLDIAQANDLEMEGACGGSCACSTCHVIVRDDEFYDKMEEPSDDENDMLDLAFGLTETSRLGCQVVMSRELDGVVVCDLFGSFPWVGG